MDNLRSETLYRLHHDHDLHTVIIDTVSVGVIVNADR